MEWKPAKFNREFLSKNVNYRADSWKQWYLIDPEQRNLSPLAWQSGDWIWINAVRHEYYVSDGWVLTQLYLLSNHHSQEFLSNFISLCLSNYHSFEVICGVPHLSGYVFPGFQIFHFAQRLTKVNILLISSSNYLAVKLLHYTWRM